MRQYLTTLDQIINQINPSFILCIINRHDQYTIIKRQLCIDRAGNQFLKLVAATLCVLVGLADHDVVGRDKGSTHQTLSVVRI